VETILRRGELNTRPRDFYDVYILPTTQKFEHFIFTQALKRTASHRETTHIFYNIMKRLEEIRNSETLKSRWIKYTKDYRYADGITYDDILNSIIKLVKENISMLIFSTLESIFKIQMNIPWTTYWHRSMEYISINT